MRSKRFGQGLPPSVRWAALVSILTLPSCVKPPPPVDTPDTSSVSPEEARAIAEEAYVYAYPMMESYRTMYVQAIDRTANGYRGTFNELHHDTRLLGPEFKDIVRPNNDTMYSFAWLDLRAQPVVITVPAIEDRYYSVQLVDMFTHNFAYIGTRATGGDDGGYVVAGRAWKEPAPPDTRGLFQSESDFVYCIVRIEVRGERDARAVNTLQQGFRVSPMNVFLGRSNAPEASGLTFPSYDAGRAQSPGFIDLFNFLLAHVDVVPEEAALMERFGGIGVRPGARAASLSLDDATRDAVEDGIDGALITMQKAAANPASLDGVRARTEGGWQGLDGIFGDGPEMRSKYLVRALAAKVGLYGNDTVEAYYPMSSRDAEGEPLDGAKHAYVMRFARDALPEARAFWSMTMYSLPDQLMVDNAIDRYSIGDRNALRYGEDGSLTIYIQRDSPGKRRQTNWLPAPDGPFSLQFRVYLPAPSALDPLYLPPPVEVAR